MYQKIHTAVPGLIEGVLVSVEYLSGEHTGKKFTGLLSCDVEIGQPIFLKNNVVCDVSANITLVECIEAPEYFKITTEKGSQLLLKIIK